MGLLPLQAPPQPGALLWYKDTSWHFLESQVGVLGAYDMHSVSGLGD